MTRQARRPASERTLGPGAPLLSRPIAGDAPEATTTGIPSPAEVAAPLRGHQDLRYSSATHPHLQAAWGHLTDCYYVSFTPIPSLANTRLTPSVIISTADSAQHGT